MIVSHTCLVLGSVGRRGGAERTRARHQTNNFLIDLGTQMTKGGENQDSNHDNEVGQRNKQNQTLHPTNKQCPLPYPDDAAAGPRLGKHCRVNARTGVSGSCMGTAADWIMQTRAREGTRVGRARLLNTRAMMQAPA